MSEDNVLLFKDAYLAAYKLTTWPSLNNQDAAVTVPNRQVTIVGLPSMVGSNRMWMTYDWNKVRLLKKSENKYKFDLQELDRQVKMLGDWWECLNYYIPQYVWINDQN